MRRSTSMSQKWTKATRMPVYWEYSPQPMITHTINSYQISFIPCQLDHPLLRHSRSKSLIRSLCAYLITLPACTTASTTAVAMMTTNSSANLKFVWLNPSWWHWVQILLQDQTIKTQTSNLICAADVHWQYSNFVFGIPPVITRELTTAVPIRFNFAGDNVMWSTVVYWTVTQIPSVYYCNMSSFQSGVTNPCWHDPDIKHAGCVCI